VKCERNDKTGKIKPNARVPDRPNQQNISMAMKSIVTMPKAYNTIPYIFNTQLQVAWKNRLLNSPCGGSLIADSHLCPLRFNPRVS
jgi:hypothetical protein